MKYLIIFALFLGNSKVLAMDQKSQSTAAIEKQLHIDVKDIVTAWQAFIASKNWPELIKNIPPLTTGCGIVYELPNFLNRPNEDFAIVDMRTIPYAEPHYHPTGNIEIYFVLSGTALVVVGEKKQSVQSGDIIIIEPDTAHFTIPDNQYVIAVVNTPPYKPENYISLKESNPLVKFNQEQFNKLTCKK